MSLPLDTFDFEARTIYPDPPWIASKQRPIDWFRESARQFVHDLAHIVAEAVEYPAHDAPQKPGIYFLLLGDAIVYVGSSNGIARRLEQHAQRFDFDRYWCFGGIPELFLQEVEGYYIDRVGAPLNCKQHDFREFAAFIDAKNDGLTASEILGIR